MLRSTHRRGLLSTAVVLSCLVGLAAAHGTVAIAFDTESQSLQVGEQAEIPVVVQRADDGVGGYDITVSTNGSGRLAITDVGVAGRPATVERTIADDGASARVSASGLALSGPATRVFTVTVEGVQPGTATLRLSSGSVRTADGGPALVASRGTSEVVVARAPATPPGSATADQGVQSWLPAVAVGALVLALSLAVVGYVGRRER